MSTMTVIVKGAKQVEKRLQAEALKIQRNQDRAAKAGAQVYVRALKAALPKGTEPGKTHGYLKKHVHVYQVPGVHGAYAAKVTGHEAHLVLGDTKLHEIDPRGLQDSQTHAYNRKAHARMQGPQITKRALSWQGATNPSARAIHPAHRGDHELIPRVRLAAAPEARLAAIEVLKHG